MGSYLEPEEDGLPVRDSGEWVIEKLDYLERYISVFSSSMHKRQWRGIHYIDLFAGPGKCRARDTKTIHLGSPLLALRAPHPFTRYFFVDMDAPSVSALQTRCSTSPLQDRVACHLGDSNKVVHEIVRQIREIDEPYIAGKWHSLNLAFLDPEGLELQWATVESLSRVKYIDLIIHYPQMGLTREMPNAMARGEPTAVDEFFGDRGWGIIYGEPHKRGLQRRLLDYYEGKLHKLGYVEIRTYEPLMRNVKRKAPLYRLLFASRNPLGAEFWEKVTSRDVYGQRRLLEPPSRY